MRSQAATGVRWILRRSRSSSDRPRVEILLNAFACGCGPAGQAPAAPYARARGLKKVRRSRPSYAIGRQLALQ
ncbi:hypothetical protein DENSPDRAFT_453505 [Dentipellis sp. KUC8613]|nr:hypothetical protein DENSPDRAFT_453505 [Dentipellis sp. KUC8613]